MDSSSVPNAPPGTAVEVGRSNWRTPIGPLTTTRTCDSSVRDVDTVRSGGNWTKSQRTGADRWQPGTDEGW